MNTQTILFLYRYNKNENTFDQFRKCFHYSKPNHKFVQLLYKSNDIIAYEYSLFQFLPKTMYKCEKKKM